MSNYDFHALLEPLEFEKLVCDIISQREQIPIRIYKEGRDLGIDGSYTDSNKKIIVQAKRYHPDFKKLYRSLERFELPKVRKLQPDRYILGISMELSKHQVDQIIHLFKEFNVNEHDILDRIEMNNLLEQPAYKQTLLKYPKLWFPNINVLEKVLNRSVHRATFQESIMELKEAFETAKIFYPTKIYHKALQNWTQNQVIVLSGEPGVGKTTMAYILALAYLQPDNLDGFVWANSIQDVYKMLENEVNQVFIMDDFWGSIFLGEHTRIKDENRLNKLIKRIVEFHGSKRLILTTREYILQQGLQKHPLLKRTLEQFALICTMDEYSDEEKASILFSHLYASNLEYEYVYYLYRKTDWIVRHQNYSPRVLALFLNNKPATDCSPQDYYEQLCDYFDNPGDFWKSIFLELSPEAQFVAMLLLVSSTPMHRESMERCYQNYIHIFSPQTMVKNLGDCIAELEKTMIKSIYSEEYEDVLLKFSMPAVQDFLYAHLQENSEQWVPKLLECCSYYNQLQFLLEHLSKYCSDKTRDLIIEQCIRHYHTYVTSVIEYDGSWNWDIESIEETQGRLDRFFHLLRFCESYKDPKLYIFLENEITNYCITMGNDDPTAQYFDLVNLPDIISRCIKKGMPFNGKDIINKYYENAFSVHHYSVMQKFQEVFPEEYASFHEAYFPRIRSSLKSTLLLELEFLDEFGMDMEFDILIDKIPALLEEFNLRYTEEFGRKIFDLYGRKPTLKKDRNERPFNPSVKESDWDEPSLENVKDDAWNWLLGINETYLDDEEIIEYISNSKLDMEVKEELKKILKTTTPRYVYNFLQTRESISLLSAAMYNAGTHLLEQESNLIMTMLLRIVNGDPALMQKLVGFCAESLSMFMYRDEPVLRAIQFFKSDVYTNYLKNDAHLSEVVFEHLIVKDEQWVRFLNVPLFIFCNACVICFGSDEEELENFYPEIWGENFNKFKQVVRYASKNQSNILYADFGPYLFKNYEWEGCMYRMFEELKPYHFNQTYVAPIIKSYLDKLGDGDETSKILKHISLSRLEFQYNKSGDRYTFSHELSDELCMIEHLGISEIWNENFPPQITKSKFNLLIKDEIAYQVGDEWRVLVYKIKNMELLKEFGVYESAIEFLRRVESVHSRFLNGDYSQIRKPL